MLYNTFIIRCFKKPPNVESLTIEKVYSNNGFHTTKGQMSIYLFIFFQ
jgi:hypothetical protein